MNGWNHKRFTSNWRKKRVKTWYLAVALVLLLAGSAVSLRRNNVQMVKLRSEVVAADESGGDVGAKLKALNDHIFRHMNTQIVRPVELVGTYNRQAQAVIEAANKNTGRDIYGEATQNCERRGIPLTSIAQCAADYALANNPVGATKITLPDKNLYKYSFSSPRWTPDLAGFMVLFTVVIALWLGERIVEAIAVRLVIRRRLRNGF